MKLKKIKEINFKVLDNKNEKINFTFNNNQFNLILDELNEVYMTVYFFENISLYKNGQLLDSGRMLMPHGYYEPVSPNKKFIYLNINGSEIINLKTNTRMKGVSPGLRGNRFNQSSTKILIKDSKKIQVFDLSSMTEIYQLNIDYTDAFFVGNNLIWILKIDNSIVQVNLKNEHIKKINIVSPFLKFNIDINKYQALIDKNTHCLALPKGGMAHSCNLNRWIYLDTKDKIIFKTMIPTSDIFYNKNYKRDYCIIEFKYFEIIKIIPNEN